MPAVCEDDRITIIGFSGLAAISDKRDEEGLTYKCIRLNE